MEMSFTVIKCIQPINRLLQLFKMQFQCINNIFMPTNSKVILYRKQDMNIHYLHIVSIHINKTVFINAPITPTTVKFVPLYQPINKKGTSQ